MKYPQVGCLKISDQGKAHSSAHLKEKKGKMQKAALFASKSEHFRERTCWEKETIYNKSNKQCYKGNKLFKEELEGKKLNSLDSDIIKMAPRLWSCWHGG